jgi:AcrR family transcriptional regulator
MTVIDPNPASLRDRKKQQTRSALHDAASALVEERGLAGVTVEEICARADVSPRTFFNYFPSKSAAALGLPPTLISDEDRSRFAEGGATTLLDDLCALLATKALHSEEHARRKRLLDSRPELTPALMQWLYTLRQEITALAATRVPERTGRIAVALVVSAMLETQHEKLSRTPAELASRMRATVTEMCALDRSA